uniref:Uncharacterized protein n=1 Tax=Globisporangium ultimum (strain ATCC 200006 / CBS 805.95 / DAOM BR144) TaxID=431595 RepID=K3WAD1_GLOUD
MLDSGMWHVRLARLLAASGRFAQARSHYEAALNALALRQQQQPALSNQDEAAAAASPASSSSSLSSSPPEDPTWKILFELAAVKVQLQERHDAIATYRRIVKNRPQFAEAHANLAAQLMIDGDLDAALHHCQEALSLEPEYKEAHYNMNVLLRRVGRQREAIDAYWALIEQHIRGCARPLTRTCERVCKTASTGSDTPRDQGAHVVSVICVKWGTKYGAEYVNKLYHSLMRHHREGALAIDFVCLTDDASGIISSTENVRCLPLAPGWRGWWNKVQVFSPTVAQALYGRTCLYMDLDTVIVDCIDDLLAWTPPEDVMALLTTDHMTNEQRQNGFNSSLMMWRNEAASDNNNTENGKSTSFAGLYRFLHEHFSVINKYIYKFDHYLEMALPRPIFLEDVFPDSIVEYKSLGDESASMAPPTNASIVCFPLQPKPHNAKAPWIATHWR